MTNSMSGIAPNTNKTANQDQLPPITKDTVTAIVGKWVVKYFKDLITSIISTKTKIQKNQSSLIIKTTSNHFYAKSPPKNIIH
jgi:hypothetical protein